MAVMLLVFVTTWVWTHLSAGVYTSTTSPPGPTSVNKNLMMLEAGSGSRFDSMWSQQSYNDAGGTKSDMGTTDVLSGGEFKVAIDPTWGDPDWVWLTFLSANGAVIGTIQFYTPNTNISGHTSWMPATFDIIEPLNSVDATFIVSKGNTDVIVRQPSTTNMWIAALHTTSGPEFVLATTVAGSFRTGSSDSLGCKPVTELSTDFQTTSSNMTIEFCLSLCAPKTYDFIGMQHGNSCHCVNVNSNVYPDLPEYCKLTCPGDGTQTCGGTSSAYMSVYNASGSSPTVFDTQNTTLLSVSQGGSLTILAVILQNEPTWPGEYMYVNGITVLGLDDNGVNVTYSIEYTDYNSNTFIPYDKDLNGTLWEGQTGVTYDLETILIQQLRVLFSGPATGVTIDLIGPSGNAIHPGYVTARYLLVSGLFTTPTSTTTSSFGTTPSPSSSSSPTITSSTNVTPSTSTTTTVPSTVSTTTTPGSSTESTTTTPTSSTVSTTTTPASSTVSTTTTPASSTVSTTTTPASSTVSTTTTPASSTVSTTTTPASSTVSTTTTPASSTVSTTTTQASSTVSTTTTPTSSTVSTATTPGFSTESTTTTPTSSTVSTTTTPASSTVSTTTTPASSTVSTTTTPASSTVSTTTTPASSTESTTTTPASLTVSTTAASARSTIAFSTTTPVVSNYSIVINGQVYCPCTVTIQNVTNVTTTDIEAIIAELTLDKSTLSSNTRKYNSADDSRSSAKTLGALGVIVISIVVGSVVIMDSTNLIAEAGKIKMNYRYLKKQLSRKSLKIDDLSTISNNQDSRSQSLPEVCM